MMSLHIRTINNSGEQHPIFDFFFPDLALDQSSHVMIIDIFCHTVKMLKIEAFLWSKLSILVDNIHV